MTALAGYWAFGGSNSPLQACRSMLNAQAMYGPDGSAVTAFATLAMGRALFRLLPEDRHDKQPVTGGGGRYHLIADGRVDNRSELAAALGISSSEAAAMADSDIVLQTMIRWGEQGLERLLGDYAFAFFDAHAQRLLLVRDPLGQRPLFWHRGPDFFAFASMPSGLRALEGVPHGADADTLARFLALLPVQPEASYYKDIFRVRPGHVLRVTEQGAESVSHWTPQRRELRLKDFDAYVEAFRWHLDQAVAVRLRGSGGLAASHLSGGWDSSAVTATAARLMAAHGGRVTAFTSVPRRGSAAVAPANRFADEGALAAATADLYPNVDHILVEPSGGSPMRELEHYLECFQRPPFNLLNHLWLADIRVAARRRGGRILLTGEIGNWTISASPNSILADFVRQRRWRAWFREARGMLAGGRARPRGVLASSVGPWLPLPMWRWLRRFSTDPGLAAQSALHPRLAGALHDVRDHFDFGPPSRPRDNFERTAAALEEMDFGEYRKGVLGGWGIDKRDATADLRLVEFCLSLPLEMLSDGGVRRPLARAALGDRLPAAVLNEGRKGYQAADWHEAMTEYRGDLAALLEEIAAHQAASSLVDVDALRQWIAGWPSDGWGRMNVIARYRTALPQALAAGAFAIRASR
jgi:asparagine synthase (glutamine-hydrolysing)